MPIFYLTEEQNREVQAAFDGKLPPPETIEPLPESEGAKLEKIFAEYQRELEAQVFAAFGYPRIAGAIRACGCRGIVHTCNQIT
jgi:hypothetical protein